MATVEIDRDRCEGHGLCEQTAAEIYRLNDDGEVYVLVADIGAELLTKAEEGARVCPVAALRVRH
jgi:ferredoxin